MSKITSHAGLVLTTAFIAVAALATPAAAQARGCAHANTSAAAAPRNVIKDTVVCLINEQRRDHGLPALRQNSRLDRSAQGWTNTMVATDQFTHGSDFTARLTAAGFDWSTAGENIATGFATPRQVVDGWMASTGHCQNILNPQFTNVGTGVVARGITSLRSSAATWTQDFGLPMGAHSPSDNFGPADGCPYRV